jgi:hypothetical protein
MGTTVTASGHDAREHECEKKGRDLSIAASRGEILQAYQFFVMFSVTKRWNSLKRVS